MGYVNRLISCFILGLLWSKQFYHYIVDAWFDGDPDMPKPSVRRLEGRNKEWTHLFNRDVISMPDKWEYPWVSERERETETETEKQRELFIILWYSMLRGI